MQQQQPKLQPQLHQTSSSLSPDELATFENEMQKLADKRVEELTVVGINILQKIPGRVAKNLEPFRCNWGEVYRLIMSDIPNVNGPSKET